MVTHLLSLTFCEPAMFWQMREVLTHSTITLDGLSLPTSGRRSQITLLHKGSCWKPSKGRTSAAAAGGDLAQVWHSTCLWLCP